MTSGYLPIGAAIVGHRIAEAFSGDDAAVFAHLVTFGGNPPACAAALANLDIMEGEKMADNAAAMGELLYERMQSLRRHPIVGDVRGGLGLLAAVELVRDRETRERFPKSAKLGQRATRALRRHRLLGRAGDVIPVAPPLCITPDEVEHVIERLDLALTDLANEL